MSLSAELQIKNWDQFITGIRDKIRGTTKTKQYAGIISANVYRDIIQHFEDEKGPNGRWQKFSKSYLEAINGTAIYRTIKGNVRIRIPAENLKTKPKPPRKMGKLLQVTGRLRQSFVPKNFKVINGSIIFYNDARTSTNFPYAFAHNEGGDLLPKREFMWLSDDALEEIADQTLEWLAEENK